VLLREVERAPLLLRVPRFDDWPSRDYLGRVRLVTFSMHSRPFDRAWLATSHPVHARQHRSREHRPLADAEHRRSFAERAQQALSNVGQDDRVKQAAARAKEVAERAEGASKTVTRKVGQEDAWDELRGDVELLTEVARAQHALIVDLIDRVAELERRAGTGPVDGAGA
jgi:hypothetical protein